MDTTDAGEACVQQSPILTELPEEILGMVGSYVGMEDIPNIMRASKKFGPMLRHPSTWRHRTVTALAWHGKWGAEPKASEFCCYSVCSVLRLAPRVKVLEWSPPLLRDPPRDLTRFLRSMKCGIKTLKIVVRPQSHISPVIALLTAQSRIGCLERLDIEFPYDYGSQTTAVIKAALSVVSLTDFRIVPWKKMCCPCYPDLPQPPFKIACRLKRFHCCVCSLPTSPFLDFVTYTCRSTLEDVQYCRLCAQCLKHVADLPNLRVLKCTIVPGLDRILSHLELHTLKLTATELCDFQMFEDLAKMVRTTPKLKLKCLHLRSREWLEDEGCLLLPNILGAFVENSFDTLEELTVYCRFRQFPRVLLQTLCGLVSKCEVLKRLDVNGRGDADAVLSAVLKRPHATLRSLTLSVEQQCIGAWIQSNLLQQVLLVHPGIHVRTHPFNWPVHCTSNGGTPCSLCSDACYTTLLGPNGSVGLCFPSQKEVCKDTHEDMFFHRMKRTKREWVTLHELTQAAQRVAVPTRGDVRGEGIE